MVNQYPIKEDSDVIPYYDAFQQVPLTHRVFHILRPTKIQYVFPSRISSPPIDPSSIDGGMFTTGLKNMAGTLLFRCYGAGDGNFIRSIPYDDKIPCSTFDYLHFKGIHPSAGISSILTSGVNKHSTIPGFVFPWFISFPVPFELNGQFIVFIILIGRNTAPFFTCYPDHSILNGKYLLWVYVFPPVLQERIPAIQ